MSRELEKGIGGSSDESSFFDGQIVLCSNSIGTNNMFEAGSMILSKNWTPITCTLNYFARL